MDTKALRAAEGRLRAFLQDLVKLMGLAPANLHTAVRALDLPKPATAVDRAQAV